MITGLLVSLTQGHFLRMVPVFYSLDLYVFNAHFINEITNLPKIFLVFCLSSKACMHKISAEIVYIKCLTHLIQSISLYLVFVNLLHI